MNYDFNWQIVYNYADDVAPLLPAGTIMHVISWHDNSAGNKNNPDPRNWVGFGNRTTDDMARHWLTFYYMTDEEFKAEVAARNALKAKRTQPAHEPIEGTAPRPLSAALARLAASLRSSAVSAGARLTAQVRYATGQNVVPGLRRLGAQRRRHLQHGVRLHEPQLRRRSRRAGRAGQRARAGRAPIRGSRRTSIRAASSSCSRVRVPKDWGKKDLVWTLTAHGKTEKAYGSLMPVWEIDAGTYQQNRGGPGELGEADDPPSIAIVGPARRTAVVGQPLALAVTVDDDGKPTPRPSRSGTGTSSARTASAERVGPRPPNPVTQAVVRLDPGMRLGVIWVVHRRSVAGSVTFDPAKSAVADRKAATTATFSQPGVYTIRAYADDGILLDSTDIEVTVR